MLQLIKTKIGHIGLAFQEEAEKETVRAIDLDSRMSVGKQFEIYRCQSETYEAVFCTGDLGIVDCGGDLLSLRKQALFILSGVVIQSLVWPASSVGEWIPKAYIKPGRIEA